MLTWTAQQNSGTIKQQDRSRGDGTSEVCLDVGPPQNGINIARIDSSIKWTSQCYISHRLKDVNRITFLQAWIAKPDFNCAGEINERGEIIDAGMNVLQPAWRAFVGFGDKSNEYKKQED